MNPLRIAVAQINCTVGDLAGNARRILELARQRARAAGADLMLTPELALCPAIRRKTCCCARFLPRLRSANSTAWRGRSRGIAVVVGHPRATSASGATTRRPWCSDGRGRRHLSQAAPAQLRSVRRGALFRLRRSPACARFKGVRCGINICADVWEAGAADAARRAGAELLLVLNASPYHINKQAAALRGAARAHRRHRHAGGLRQSGRRSGRTGVRRRVLRPRSQRRTVSHQLPQFEEALAIVEYCRRRAAAGRQCAAELPLEAEVYRALVLGVRDYLGKNGFPGAIIGLSGGIDSALTLCIAVDALGADKVRAVMMPSPYTARDQPRRFARDGAPASACATTRSPIAPAMATFAAMLAAEFAGLPRRYDRREPAGAHPRHDPDGAVEQDRLASC